MAVAYDSTSTATSAGAVSLSWTHTPSGTPSSVGVGVGFYNNGSASDSITGITYGGSAMALEIHVNLAGGNRPHASIWRLGSPASGAQTVSITCNATTRMTGGVVAVTGSDVSTIFSNHVTTTGTIGNISETCTSATGELVMDAIGTVTTGSVTVGSGQTQRWQNLSNSVLGAGSTEPGAATVAMDWTVSGNMEYAGVAASFQAAAAGGTRPVKMAGEWGGYAGMNGGFAG